MGPSMARLARQATELAGVKRRIIGISRFSDPTTQAALENDGVETIAADLLNEDDLASLPEAPNVLYLAGNKFGTTGKESFTWAMNAYLPGRVAEKYKKSRIVAFSTGNVYPFSPVTHGGVSEGFRSSCSSNSSSVIFFLVFSFRFSGSSTHQIKYNFHGGFLLFSCVSTPPN